MFVRASRIFTALRTAGLESNGKARFNRRRAAIYTK